MTSYHLSSQLLSRYHLGLHTLGPNHQPACHVAMASPTRGRLRAAFLVVLALLLAGPLAADSTGADLDLMWGYAVGADLQVTLELGPGLSESVLVKATDPAGEAIVSEWVDPMGAGRHVVVLGGALSEISKRGVDVRLTATGVSGVVYDTLSLQVGVDCGAKGLCSFTIRNGISAPSAIALRPVFAEALATALELAPDAPLGWIAKHHPELRGDLYAFGWQAGAVQRQAPDGNGDGDDCECYWLPVIERVNTLCDGPCGASHFVEATAHTGLLDFDVFGYTGLEVDLLCWKSVWGEEEVVPMAGAPDQEGRVLAIVPCNEDCTASVAYLGDLTATAEVSASSEDNLAYATQNATFTVGSTVLDSGSIQALAGFYTANPLVLGGTSTARAPGTPAMMESVGTLDLWIGHLGGPSTAWGKITAEHALSGIGFASCTAASVTKIDVHSEAFPPDIDDIDILIGKCHGP